METIFTFLVKASLGIVVFYLIYWLFLRKETFYTANRWFLVSTLFIAVALPLFPVRYAVQTDPGIDENLYRAISDTFKHLPVVSGDVTLRESFNWQEAVLIVYITGASIFIFRLLIQTFILIRIMLKYRIKSVEGIRIIENEKYGLPFSFFNVVFINPKFHTQEDLPEILAHEKVHIREFHWFDLLFIELLTVIFWFNPFIWFFEHAIKQNHEYLADDGVLAQGHNAGKYKALLINQLMGMQIIGITNNLNYALNTNRFKMMTKTKTSASRRIKFAWALPAAALLLFAFAEPDYKTSEPEKNQTIPNVQKSGKEFVIQGKVVREDNGEPLPGASIIIKGTTSGTVSDLDGNFKLTDANPSVNPSTGALSSKVVVSFVGLKTVENEVTGSGETANTKFTFKMEDAVIFIGTDDNDFPPPSPPPPPTAVKTEKNDEVFVVVEELPSYPNGFYGLSKYVHKMEQKLGKEKGIKGNAKIAFTVNAKGKVSDIKIAEQDNDDAGKAAVSIVSGMDNWTPGSQRGKSVPVKYLIPIKF